MSSESFIKDLFKSFFRSLFGVVGIGIGIVIVLMILGASFSGSSGVPHSTTARVLPNDQWKVTSFSSETPTILRINIHGTIGLDHLTKADIFKQLVESQDGELRPGQVKAVLLSINSPGGMADASDSIYRLLSEYKSRYKVPIYAYVDGLCASGGMYIACAADKIYASEDSLIGHVGVLLSPPFFNFTDLMDKLGIASKTLFAGKDKDSMNPFRPWRPNEGEAFQYIIDSMYDQFVSIVSKNRPKLTPAILKEQGARVWPTSDATEFGYIDGTANSSDEVLKNLAKEVGIEDNYQFVELETQNIFEVLFGAKTGPLFGPVEHRVRMPGDLHPDLYGKPLYMCVF
ncbi:MAG: S49 family peptidase [Verrucomicrobia bacterium]|nr:S49 family peptidase [Verrucomicrobiota bacterium]